MNPRQTAFIPRIGHTAEIKSGVAAYWREHPESAGVMLNNLDATVRAVEPIVGLITAVYTAELIEWCRDSGAYLVNTSNFRYAPEVSSVISDDFEVGRMAGKYLLGRGYRDFIYITHPTANFSAEREAGFKEIVQSAGCNVATIKQPGMGGTRIPASEYLSQLRDIVRSALEADPLTSARAVLCFSASIAEELLAVAYGHFGEAAFSIGWLCVDAPERKLLTVANHRVTAVRPDFYQVGYQGAALLAAMLRGEPPPHGPIRIPPIEVVEGTTSPGPQGRDAVVSTVLKWIEIAIDNGDPLEVCALAARAKMSARTLQRRFTSALGHGVKTEIYDRRMRHACELLRSGSMSITEIALHIGYSNPGEFSRRFRRCFGKSPRDWRAINGKACG